MLVKVRADAATRGQVLDAVQLFRAKVVDVAPDAVTIEVTGNADKLERLPAGARALRHPRAGAVGHGRHRPWLPLDQRAHPPSDRRPDRCGILTGTTHDARTQAPHRRRAHRGPDVLRRRRRPVRDPGQERRGPRLRQPGPRPRPLAARLRGRRSRRSARGLEVAGQGRGRGPARADARRGGRGVRRDRDPRARPRAAEAVRRVRRAQHHARATPWSSATASTSGSATSPRPRAST